ncbi:TerB family tellurite resistance protein [Algoriphagus resistens]|uniref:TerB family tellurite resistance protein n=1 Tax=Algoriphagus resistens TaxID=1750590 RepID=UPI000A7C4018|nr:TerB family tellurite resistance protein [Algoriphagus resistens]
MKERVVRYMKRQAWMLLAVFLSMGLGLKPAVAQDQEIQQLLLNVEKLNQLKKLLVQMKEKYDIIQQGYMRVKSVTEGNFQLHDLFLDRLYKVSPKVKTYYRVGETIQLQIQLLNYTRNILKDIKLDSGSSLDDINYLTGVFSSLNAKSMRNLEELLLLITDNKFQMDDGERIRAIDRIYLDLRKVVLNGQRVTGEFRQLFRIRSKARAEQSTLKSILGDGR